MTIKAFSTFRNIKAALLSLVPSLVNVLKVIEESSVHTGNVLEGSAEEELSDALLALSSCSD